MCVQDWKAMKSLQILFSIGSYVVWIMALCHFFGLHVLNLPLSLRMLQGHHGRYRVVLRHLHWLLDPLRRNSLLWRWLIIRIALTGSEALILLALPSKRHGSIVLPLLLIILSLLLLILLLLVDFVQEVCHGVFLNLFLSFRRDSLHRKLIKCL